MSRYPIRYDLVPTPEDSLGFSWHYLAPGLSWASFTDTITTAGSRWMFPSKGAIWLWLNRGGNGLLWGNNDRFILKPGMYALTGGGDPADWTCLRYPGPHKLEVIRIDPRWLKDRMGDSHLHATLKGWLAKNCPVAFCGLMGAWENEIFDALTDVIKSSGPEKLLAEAKILQWAAIRLFRSSSPGQVPNFCACVREKTPVQRALSYLAVNLERPLQLASLARHVGIAPHYLSRKTRAETGKTLQQHLRQLRIQRACEQLLTGKTNITETALDVGYQSISHFAKAFREETGATPSKWLASRKAEKR